MNPRLKLRFIPGELQRLEETADRLGLRPSQLAHRLMDQTVSRVPKANRQLWQELARSSANLTQLGWHLRDSPTAQAELRALVEQVAGELEGLRRELLGLPTNVDGHGGSERPAEVAGIPADNAFVGGEPT